MMKISLSNFLSAKPTNGIIKVKRKSERGKTLRAYRITVKNKENTVVRYAHDIKKKKNFRIMLLLPIVVRTILGVIVR